MYCHQNLGSKMRVAGEWFPCANLRQTLVAFILFVVHHCKFKCSRMVSAIHIDLKAKPESQGNYTKLQVFKLLFSLKGELQ